MEKRNCLYCKEEIDIDKIRCDDCNLVWGEGVKFGKEEVKFGLRNIFNDVNKLIVKDEMKGGLKE